MYLERETSGATLAENCCTKNKKTPDRCRGLMYLEREISGATLAENCCTKNKKPLTEQGPYVFGAGNSAVRRSLRTAVPKTKNP